MYTYSQREPLLRSNQPLCPPPANMFFFYHSVYLKHSLNNYYWVLFTYMEQWLISIALTPTSRPTSTLLITLILGLFHSLNVCSFCLLGIKCHRLVTYWLTFTFTCALSVFVTSHSGSAPRIYYTFSIYFVEDDKTWSVKKLSLNNSLLSSSAVES